MENASKALIIAGAILIAILLISIGIILVNSGRDVTETGTTGMNSQKIRTFNAQFTSYEGERKGSEIRGLWNTVKSSNGANKDGGKTVTINPDAMPANIQSMGTYTVKLDYSNEGYVSTITVTGPNITSGS